MLSSTRLSIQRQHAAARTQQGLLLAGSLVVASLGVALLSLGRYDFVLALVIGLAGVLVLVRRPQLGFYTVFGAALLIDHTPVNLLSKWIPFWQTVHGLPVAAVLMLTGFGFFLFQRGHRGHWPLLRLGRLFVPCGVFLGVLAYGLWRGLSYQDLQEAGRFQPFIAFIEVGALLYFPVTYLVAHNFVTSPQQVRTLVWITITCLGLAALQTTWTVASGTGGFARGWDVASHESSLFWNMLVLLAVGLWACRGPRRPWRVLWSCLPFVAFALVANQRRTGFVALVFGLLVCGALLLADRQLCRRVLPVAAAVSLLLTGYTALFWNADGALAAPITFLRSTYAPEVADSRMQRSNLWREQEKVNIERTIQRSPVLGIGFGQRYVVWVRQWDISGGMFYWQYVTHNAVYWLWMKLGVVGFASFWYLIGSTIVLGCRVFRLQRDPLLQAATLMAVGLLAMQVVFAYGYIVLGSGCNGVYVGTWLGLWARLYRVMLDLAL